MNTKVKGALMTLTGGISWGLSGTMGQYLFTKQGMDSRWLVPIRLFLAGVLLFIYCFIKEREKLFGIWKDKKARTLLLFYGLAGVSASQFTYFTTIQLSSAGVGTILQDLSPIMILMVTCVIAGRKPKIREIFSLILGILGVFMIVTHGNVTDMVVSNKALIFGIICAACVTVYNMLTKPLTEKYPVTVLQTWSFLMGGVLLELGFRSWRIDYHPNMMGILGIVFVVVIGNIVAFTVYIKGVEYIGPDQGILYGFSEPITAAVAAVLIFGSKFTMWDLLGFACVFLMLAFISVGDE